MKYAVLMLAPMAAALIGTLPPLQAQAQAKAQTAPHRAESDVPRLRYGQGSGGVVDLKAKAVEGGATTATKATAKPVSQVSATHKRLAVANSIKGRSTTPAGQVAAKREVSTVVKVARDAH